MRADKLQFNIAYKNFEYTENASKLRVFCYMKNGGYAFGDEFSDLTSATFDSTRTAKYSGYGTITIQLVDAEENLINSANVVCKIIESNSTTPFVVSPDFAQESKREIQAIVDEGKGEIAITTKEAKEKIDSWTDQSSRIAKNESNITNLQLFKANTGALHFNGGYLSCSGLANKQIPKENTIAFRWKIDAQTFENLENYYRIIGRQLLHYTLFKSGNVVQLTVMYDDNTSQHVSFPSSNVANGEWHSIVITSTSSAFNFYVDNVLLKSANKNKSNDFIIPSGSFIVSSSSATKSIGSIADVCYFNFDMSAEDAPYTIADYQQGKPIPPNLLNVVLFGDGKNPNVLASDTSHSWDGNNYILTQNLNAQTVKAIRYEKFINKGDIVNLSFSNLIGGVFRDGAYGKIELLYVLNNVLTPLKTITLTETTLNEIYTASDNITQIRFTFNCDTATSAEYKVPTILENFKIFKNGAILALEDYTITNGTTKMVFDYSGNSNDATIKGDVKGDNDNRVQRLIDFIK